MEQYTNSVATTLNGAINNSVTSVVVTSATGFPASGDFRVKCESEIMLVTAISGTTLTVTRGSEGTTAASHADLTAISLVLTKQSLLNLIGESNSFGTYASAPAPDKSGMRYKSTDIPLELISSGSAWTYWVENQKCDPSDISGFSTWVNQNGASWSDWGPTKNLNAPGRGAVESMSMRAASLPGGASYTLTVGFIFKPPISGFANVSIGLRNSSTGHFNFIMAIYRNSAVVPNFEYHEWTSPTSGSQISARVAERNNDLLWARIRFASSTWHLEVSADNQATWAELTNFTTSNSNLGTPDQFIIGLNPRDAGSTYTYNLILPHCKVT